MTLWLRILAGGVLSGVAVLGVIRCTPFHSNDEPSVDAAAADVVTDDAAVTCPGRAGPTMVRIPTAAGSYCIDATEVTNAQYTAFVAVSDGVDRSTLPGFCLTHGPFVPLDDSGASTFPYPTGADNDPVVRVDSCDAYAYCLWAGKRLCGRIGGGTNPPESGSDPNASQWYRACSRNGSQLYPYGQVFDVGACNNHDSPDGGAAATVGTFAGCEGGYPGLLDISGNVEEVEDSCDDDGGCLTRGGSFVDQPADGQTRCDSLSQRMPPNARFRDVGFRCCGP